MIQNSGRLYFLAVMAAALCLCTKLPPDDLTMLSFSTPEIFSVVPGDASVTVSWNDSESAPSYNIYYQAGTTVDKATGTKIAGATVSPTNITGLTNGTQYAFAVTAVTATGESGLSNVKTATPQASGGAPSAPAITNVTPGNGNATVSWNTVNGATSYNLYYEAGATVDKASGILRAGVSSGYTVVSLTNGATYAFAVSAVNGAGESPLSSVATATPTAGATCVVPTVSQPLPQTVTAPAPATFSVTASGTGPLSYQWQRAEAATPATFVNVASGTGGTTASYTTAATSRSDSGALFRCFVTNGCPGSATSLPTALTVNSAAAGTVTDTDGNVYHTVTIGTQVWMVENLKTTRLNDGTAIPLVTGNSAWTNLSTPGYCYYNDSALYGNSYGALYNWYTVKAGTLAPKGWHVPSDSEWSVLTTFLGGATVAGGKLKEAGTTHWESPNTGATNETGFSALPGGYRYDDGTFDYSVQYGYWWSSTVESATDSWFRSMNYLYAGVNRNSFSANYGYSVRCVKN